MNWKIKHYHWCPNCYKSWTCHQKPAKCRIFLDELCFQCAKDTGMLERMAAIT
jgi:hypothetical protein